MVRRDYVIRVDPERKDWQLCRLEGDAKIAGHIASYSTREEAVVGCESMCERITAEGNVANLSIWDENGVEIERRIYPAQSESLGN
jgi:hypothetical protein